MFPSVSPIRRRACRLLGLLTMLTLVTVLAACGGADDGDDTSAKSTGTTRDAAGGGKPSGEPIRLGFVGPLSGNFAVSTTAVKQTLETWVDYVNDNGGVLGRPVEIVEKDDQASPEKTVQVVRELVESGTKIIVGPVTNATALQPLAGQLDFINFTILPRPQLADGKAFPNTFNSYPSNALAVDFLGSHLPDKGLKKWAILADTTEGQQQYMNQLVAKAGQVGAQVVLKESFDPQSVDLSPQAQKVKSAKPDAILFFSVGGTVGRFMQAVQAAGVDTPIYGSAGISASDLSVAPPEVLDEQVHTVITKSAILVDGAPIKGFQPLTKALYAKFGKDAVKGSGMTIQFDTFEMIKFAAEQAGAPDPAKMRQVMNSKVQDKSFLSPEVTWSFSETNHSGYTTDADAGMALAKPVPSKEWPGYYEPAE